METGVLYTLLVVAAVFIFEGMRGYRKADTLSSFFLMEGKLNRGALVGTLAATNFSLGNMIFLSMIWGYFYGFSGILWLWIGFIFAAFVYVRFVRNPQVAAYINDHGNSGSVHEYLEKSFTGQGDVRTARYLRLAASLATVLCLIVALTLELYLAATLLAPIIKVDVTTTFLTITALMCFYSALGGFYAVVTTDVIQGAILIVGLVALLSLSGMLGLPLAPYTEIHALDLQGILYSPGWTGILSIIGVTAGWYLVTMDTWQRACAARNAKVASSGMVIGTGLLLLGILLLGLFGIYDHLAIAQAPAAATGFSGGYNPITDLYLFAGQLDEWKQWLIGFIAIAFMAAALSTADTFLVVAGHSLVSDIMIGFGKHASMSEVTHSESKIFTGIARALIVLLGLLVAGMYFFLSGNGLLVDPLGVFYLAYSIQFALLAPVVASLWRRRPSAKAAMVALLAATVVSLGWGFGFALAGSAGVTHAMGLTVSELVYLAPIPPIVVGFLILFLWPRRVAA